MAIRAYLFRFHGRVQGVGFRLHVQKCARDNGIAGWVRNLSDGSVEAHFEGEESDIFQALEACRMGNGMCVVENVEGRAAEPEGNTAFIII